MCRPPQRTRSRSNLRQTYVGVPGPRSVDRPPACRSTGGASPSIRCCGNAFVITFRPFWSRPPRLNDRCRSSCATNSSAFFAAESWRRAARWSNARAAASRGWSPSVVRAGAVCMVQRSGGSANLRRSANGSGDTRGRSCSRESLLSMFWNAQGAMRGRSGSSG